MLGVLSRNGFVQSRLKCNCPECSSKPYSWCYKKSILQKVPHVKH